MGKASSTHGIALNFGIDQWEKKEIMSSEIWTLTLQIRNPLVFAANYGTVWQG